MIEWLVALGVLLAFLLLLLPLLLRRTKATRRKTGGGSGVMIGIGLAFAMIFDPKAAAAIELIDQKKDDAEDSESGDRP
jgi:hypothetical protein